MAFEVITEQQKELINDILSKVTEEEKEALVNWGGQMYRDGLKWGAVGLGAGIFVGATVTGVWRLARLVRARL